MGVGDDIKYKFLMVRKDEYEQVKKDSKLWKKVKELTKYGKLDCCPDNCEFENFCKDKTPDLTCSALIQLVETLENDLNISLINK